MQSDFGSTLSVKNIFLHPISYSYTYETAQFWCIVFASFYLFSRIKAYCLSIDHGWMFSTEVAITMWPSAERFNIIMIFIPDGTCFYALVFATHTFFFFFHYISELS